MKTRIITGITAIILFVPVILLNDTFVFPAVMALLCAIAAGEMTACVFAGGSVIETTDGAQAKQNRTTSAVRTILCSLICGAVVLALTSGTDGSGFSKAHALIFCAVSLIPGVTGAVAGGYMLKNRSENRALLMICALVYITVSFACLCFARGLLRHDMMFLMLFICPWTSDTAAYFFGCAFGKHKLAPVLSPKKTVEGAVAGAFFSGLAMTVFILVTEPVNITDTVLWFVLGTITGVVSQAGDIYASAYKRRFGVKDYGKIFPGHGGVLDRFDSVLGAAICSPVLMAVSVLMS